MELLIILATPTVFAIMPTALFFAIQQAKRRDH
jgi:hypothetical protein